MADLSDVTAYLAAQTAVACYPNGTSQPSVANMDVHVFEGWPIAAQLDLDMQGLQNNPNGAPTPRPNGPCADVSIFPMPGVTAEPYQVEDHTYVIVPPSYGMSAYFDGVSTVTVEGQPNVGEYLTIIADRQNVFSASGANTAAILASLLQQASGPYPSASATGNTITIPGTHAFVVRIGGIGTLGKVTHRQKHGIMITVWAPDPPSRTALSAAIDNFLKRTIVATLSDQSQAKFVYSRTLVTDEQQTATVYRRDLIFDVEYATVFQFPGYVVTSVIVNLQGGNWCPGITSAPPIIPAVDSTGLVVALPGAAGAALGRTTPTRTP